MRTTTNPTNHTKHTVRMLMNDRERLHRYFDNELPTAEREAFEQHADHDDKERLAALDDVRRAVKTTVDLQTANIDFTSSIERELARQDSQRAWRRRARLMSPLVAIAAAAAAMALWLKPTTVNPPVRAEAARIESLKVEGAVATVMNLDDDDDPTTVIFIDEDDEETL